MRELEVTKAILGSSARETIDALLRAQDAWMRVMDIQERIDLITCAQRKLR